jgi:hypothetical protein
MPTLVNETVTERLPRNAMSSRCPQCFSCMRLKATQLDERHAKLEWRTFECEECGLPRTYAVLGDKMGNPPVPPT